MKNDEWFLLGLERLSKASKNTLLFLKVDKNHEKAFVDLWKKIESDYWLNAAADETKRHTLTFFFGYPWHDADRNFQAAVIYDKKERRFTHIQYRFGAGLQYIPLKYCLL